MGIVKDLDYQSLGPEDPDDYRPNSRVAFVYDPTQASGNHVTNLSFIFEQCAPGDYVPLHTHTTDEAIIIDEGEAEVTADGVSHRVSAGSVIFIPAGVAHSWGNPTSDTIRAHGVLPSDVIDITYLERNPAPGTEGDPPQPPLTLRLRDMF